MGAGGRDFHNFNVFFRDNPHYQVVAFTATQIPFIANRVYSPALSGKLYPEGIGIYPEEELENIIQKNKAELAVFAYSDISHEYVMHQAARVMALGADFMLLGPDSTMLKSKLPVISVCAVRTGAGKSPVTRKLLEIMKRLGMRPVAIRHPMAYCDLEKQRVQRFASIEDLDTMACTIEEKEEYEPIIERGFTVFAGVDYGDILKAAEKEADVIVWDGGNNDFPFIRPDFNITVADALRPGHTLSYFPGEVNIRMADAVIVNKVSGETKKAFEEIERAVRSANPDAAIILAESPARIISRSPGAPASIKGKKVLVIEDGPTVTHGGMPFGAGFAAAKAAGAQPVSPAPYAVGSLKETLTKYSHLKEILPCMGYSEGQIEDLAATIHATPCDAVLYATPVNLSRLIKMDRPAYRVGYEIKEKGGALSNLIAEFLSRRPRMPESGTQG